MLARIVSDCALANYGPSDWASIPDRDWLQLLRESKPNARLWNDLRRIFEQRRCYSANLDKIIADRRRECAEVLEWFRGQHSGDYLGIVPRDILGMIESYLRIRIHTRLCNRDGDITSCKFSYYVMSRIESYDGLPVSVYINYGGVCKKLWTCQIKWPGGFLWFRENGPHQIYPKVDTEPCVVYEQCGTTHERYPLIDTINIADCELLATMHRDMC